MQDEPSFVEYLPNAQHLLQGRSSQDPYVAAEKADLERISDLPSVTQQSGRARIEPSLTWRDGS